MSQPAQPAPSDAPPRIAVVGGGFSGMAAAEALLAQGAQVDVFEKQSQLGGEVATRAIGNTFVEYYYHHCFSSDRHLLASAERLGVADQLTWVDSTMGFYWQGQLLPFNGPVDVLRFRPLNPLQRFRLGLSVLYLQRRKRWQPFQEISAADWMRRFCGDRVFDTIWGGLLKAKFGEDWRRVSMAWLWARIHVRAASRSKGMAKEQLGYFHNSFRTLVDAFGRRIEELGGRIHLEAPAERIIIENGQARGIVTGGERRDFDLVLAAVHTPIFLHLTPDLPEEYRQRLGSIEYKGASCLLLELDRRMSPYYWLNISAEDSPFTALVEQTNLVSPAAYGGSHLLYVARYMAPRDPLMRMETPALFDYYLPYLQQVYPAFSRDMVKNMWSGGDPFAQPLIEVGYQRKKPELRTPIPRLYLANTTLIYPEDRGINYSIRLGQEVAQHIMADAAQGGVPGGST